MFFGTQFQWAGRVLCSQKTGIKSGYLRYLIRKYALIALYIEGVECTASNKLETDDEKADVEEADDVDTGTVAENFTATIKMRNNYCYP